MWEMFLTAILGFGGYVPERKQRAQPLEVPEREAFAEFFRDSRGADVATMPSGPVT